MKRENPKDIVVCKKTFVEPEIRASSIMKAYRVNKTIFFLPFPNNGRQKEYREGLIDALKINDFQKHTDDFICPQPMRWNDIFKDLCAAYENKTGRKSLSEVVGIHTAGGPSTPLILNGWVFTGDDEKRRRWIETVDWAKKYDLLQLLTVEEKDKYRGH